MGDTTPAASFFANIDRDRREAVEEVGTTAEALRVARERYDRAVMNAHRVGATNTAIALAAKRTEAAIRLFIKRKKMVGQ